MAKIRITQPTEDGVTGKKYAVGTILDLGAMRNKKAVDTNQAQWVDSGKLEKAELLGENTEIMSAKVEVPKVTKKRVSKSK